MPTLEHASTEIIHLHQQIEAWFRGHGDHHALDALLASFTNTFQMVTIRGDRLDRNGVRTLFAQLHGARPGITLSIDQVAIVADTVNGWLVTYRETQVMPDGSSNRRHSAAWLQPTDEGRPSWLYLQETAIP